MFRGLHQKRAMGHFRQGLILRPENLFQNLAQPKQEDETKPETEERGKTRKQRGVKEEERISADLETLLFVKIQTTSIKAHLQWSEPRKPNNQARQGTQVCLQTPQK